VRLQTLRREFETLAMREKGSIQEFLSRVSEIVSQMKTYGEVISNQTVINKVLRSLSRNFDYIIAAIEKSKDLSTYTCDELMSSLQAHEARVNRSSEKVEEKAFHMNGESLENCSRGRSTGGFHGRGYGRGQGSGQGRGRHDRQRQSKEYSNTKKKVQCYYYRRYDHIQADCWFQDQKMNFAAKDRVEKKLFMACLHCNHKPSDL